MNYHLKTDFSINCGFNVTITDIKNAIEETNSLLSILPDIFYKSVDYKTTSAIIGAIFCDKLATITGAIVNPIEKGHPDIVPIIAQNCTEEELKKYPQGLEIKCTVGNIKTGVKLKAGESRVQDLTAITWQAHHREVKELLGLIWDFPMTDKTTFNFPKVTGAFYSANLIEDDWGEISGTTGRNTKVTGMRKSGKDKMGQGWLAILDEEKYLATYQQKLNFTLP